MYFLINKIEYRNYLLLIFSLFFYGWGEPRLIILMLIIVILNYYFARKMDTLNGKSRTYLFAFLVLINLTPLVYFKYFNFLVENFKIIFDLTVQFQEVMLPIGISFYTFQILSYVFDVYNRKLKAQNNLSILIIYIALFPQLIAGPIVRYETIHKELEHRKSSLEDVIYGIQRFIIGLGKKVLIANQVAIVANIVFNKTDLNSITSFHVWIGTLAFMLQIYFDFSGYSDMAIGLGRIFGFHFLENFNYPYISKSVTDFWRRWHISLSSWFRDYVYIPLGGNKVSYVIWLRNIVIVWFLTGLWHGAAWNFVMWGLYFAFFLILEKTFIGKILIKLPILNYLITMLIVFISWIIFNGNSSEQIILFIQLLIKPIEFNQQLLVDLQIGYIWPYFVIGIIASFPISKLFNFDLRKNSHVIIKHAFTLFIFIMCIIYLVDNTYNPFIYFRF